MPNPPEFTSFLYNLRIETWAYEPLREMERIARLIQQAYLSRVG